MTPREAFEEGLLRVEVDEPRPFDSVRVGYAGERGLRGEAIRFVHVLSKPAGGEIRGYVLIDGEKTLRVRTPNYTGRWPELDVEIQARVGATSTVYPEGET